MEALRDLLQLDDVEGAVVVAGDRDLRFCRLPAAVSHDTAVARLLPVLEATGAAREAELLYDQGRLYVRSFPSGRLAVLLGPFATTALVRLQCDVLVPALDAELGRRGLRRLFRRRA